MLQKFYLSDGDKVESTITPDQPSVWAYRYNPDPPPNGGRNEGQEEEEKRPHHHGEEAGKVSHLHRRGRNRHRPSKDSSSSSSGPVAVVRVQADSDQDGLCSLLAVQPLECPVHDNEADVQHFSRWQTMLGRATIDVRLERDFKYGFYIMAVTKASVRKKVLFVNQNG